MTLTAVKRTLCASGVLLLCVGCATTPPTPVPVTPAPPPAPVAEAPQSPTHTESAIARHTDATPSLGDPAFTAPAIGTAPAPTTERADTALQTTAPTGLSVMGASRVTPREMLAARQDAMRQCLQRVHGHTMSLRVAVNRNGTITQVSTEADHASEPAAACVTDIVRSVTFGPQPADTTVSLTLMAR